MNQAALETIYMFLLDEGVDVWRPVQARHLGTDQYEIVSTNPSDSTEQWEFTTGDVVRCKLRRLSDGEELVAYELVQRST